MDLPTGRALEDHELLFVVSDALINDRFNPGSDLPFQPGELLPRLGLRSADEQGKVLAANGGQEAFDSRILAVCWRLVTAGVLVPVNVRAFRISAAGRKFLSENADESVVVLASGGLVKRLEERCPGLDDITSRYAGLAQECFFSGHYHAAVVLLGVASESALQKLLNSTEAALVSEDIASERPGQGAAAGLDWLATTFSSKKRELKKSIQAAGTDWHWIDDLPRLLGPGTAIRLTRNAAGHPSDVTIDRSDAFRLFVLFPQMAEAVFVTAAALDTLSDADLE